MKPAATTACAHALAAEAGRRAALALACAGTAAVLLAGAQAPPAEAGRLPEASEAGVKAAYLYRFIGYVEWPPEALPTADAPQVIGVLGADGVLAELEPLLAGRRHRGHPLVARRVLPADAIDGLHVLYVGPGQRPPAALAGKPVLVVSDLPAAADWSAINFVVVDQRVRFEAAPAAAERAGLRLSARLLAVAERVLAPERVP